MSIQSDTRAGASWLASAVKNHPEGLLLLAAGFALLMRSTGTSRPRELDNRVYGRNHSLQSGLGSRGRTVRESLSESAQNAGDYISEVGERVTETATDYASSVSNYAEDVARGAAEQTGRLAHQAQTNLQNTISRVVQEQPLAVALVGVAAGAAVAAAFPVSELENRTLGTTGEQMREAASKAGDQLKDAASKAGQRLAAAADERGLNSDGLKEVARDVGQAFSGALNNEDKNTRPSTARTSSSNLHDSTASNNQRGSGKKGGQN